MDENALVIISLELQSSTTHTLTIRVLTYNVLSYKQFNVSMSCAQRLRIYYFFIHNTILKCYTQVCKERHYHLVIFRYRMPFCVFIRRLFIFESVFFDVPSPRYLCGIDTFNK